MIDYDKIWRCISLRNAAAQMSLNDTYYIVRSGDHYVGQDNPVWDRAKNEYRVPSLFERLCDKSSAVHYKSWDEAKSVAEQLQPEIEAAYPSDSIRFVSARVERVDDRSLISDIVDKWELYFIDGERREDGIDRIASHFFDAQSVPAYVLECKPQIVSYFRTVNAESELYLDLTDEEMDAHDDYLARLAAAKKAVSDIEIDLQSKAFKGTMEL